MDQVKAELVPAGDLRLILFQWQGVRQVFHDGEWFFSVIDVTEVLTGSPRPSKYWNDLKKQLIDTEGVAQLSPNRGQLKLPSPDGRMRETDTINTEALLRIVQSIPSPKANAIKSWLAPEEATR